MASGKSFLIRLKYFDVYELLSKNKHEFLEEVVENIKCGFVTVVVNRILITKLLNKVLTCLSKQILFTLTDKPVHLEILKNSGLKWWSK